MNTLQISMPYEYVSQIVALTWKDMLYAVKEGFLPESAAANHSFHALKKDEDPAQALLELSWLPKGAPTLPYLEELASTETKQDFEECQAKFLYLLLRWVFEHRVLFPKPLDTALYIYADFDYPETMASFIRYMPMSPGQGADEGRRILKENEGQMLLNWECYLNKQGEIWKFK